MGKKSSRVFSLAKLLQGMASLWRECINLFYSQVGRVRLSMNLTKAFEFQAEGQGPLKQALVYDYNNKSNEKQVKQFSKWSQNWLLLCSRVRTGFFSETLLRKCWLQSS